MFFLEKNNKSVPHLVFCDAFKQCYMCINIDIIYPL